MDVYIVVFVPSFCGIHLWIQFVF